MTTRRSFLGTVAGGVGAAVAWQGIARAEGARKPPIGLQLWSVRDQMDKDLPGTLRQVKAWGIEEVESAGLHGRSAPDFAAELKKAGLRCHAMHVGWDELEKDIAGRLRDADAVGATTLVNPYLPHEGKPYATREEILRAAARLSAWSRECRAAGKRLAYHTHSQEFGPAPEGTLFDVLAKESGPDVGFEFDVFWVVWGGADPVKLLNDYPGRVWYTHLKDMARGTVPGRAGQDLEKANVPLGAGMMDVAGIVEAGRKAGVEIHFIEDESAQPTLNIPKSVAFYKDLRA